MFKECEWLTAHDKFEKGGILYKSYKEVKFLKLEHGDTPQIVQSINKIKDKKIKFK